MPTPPKRYLSPPAIAKELSVKSQKVLSWIKSGELVAINLAESATGRPRWRIYRDAFDLFLENRTARQPAAPPTHRRRKRETAGKEYF